MLCSVLVLEIWDHSHVERTRVSDSLNGRTYPLALEKLAYISGLYSAHSTRTCTYALEMMQSARSRLNISVPRLQHRACAEKSGGRDPRDEESGSLQAPSHDRLQDSIALVCPTLKHAGSCSFDWRVDANALNRCGQPLHTIGLELRVAFAMIGKIIVSDSDNSFWLRKCRELCVRPAIEPLVLAHWAKLTTFRMTEPQVANFSSLLCGSKQQARTRDSYGLWEDGDVRFEPAEQARHWWEDIQSVANDPQLAPLFPSYCFARTIIAHPYPDGNGRLARALVHAALARTTGMNAPALPLAPAFYMNGAKVGLGLRRLSETGDWQAFNTVFVRLIEDAHRLAQCVGTMEPG